MDPSDPLDAALDADFDGFTNLEEYRLGTSPVERGSAFWLFSEFSIADEVARSLALRWLSRPGNRYEVLESAFPVSAEADLEWVPLREIEAPEGTAVTSVEIDLQEAHGDNDGPVGALYRVRLLESSVPLQ